MKRILACLIACIMVLQYGIVAFAEETLIVAEEPIEQPMQNVKQTAVLAVVQTVGEPVQDTIVVQPAQEQSIQEPVVEQTVQEPVKEQLVQESVVEQPVQEPVVEQTIQESVEEQPVLEPSVARAVQELVVEQSVQETNEEQPIYEHNVEQTVQVPVVEQTIQETVEEQPIQEPSVAQAVQKLVAEQPVQEPIDEQTVQESTVDQAVEEPVAEQPVEEIVLEQTVQESAVELGGLEFVEEETIMETATVLAAEASVEEPAETSANEEGVAEEEATEETVNEENTNEKSTPEDGVAQEVSSEEVGNEEEGQEIVNEKGTTDEIAIEEATTEEEEAAEKTTEEVASEETIYEEKAAEEVAAEETVTGKTEKEENNVDTNTNNDKNDQEEIIEISNEDEELTIETEASNAAPFAYLEKEQSTKGFVYRLYKIVLGREPDADGLNYWVNELNSGKRNAASAVAGFFESKEYEKKGKSTSEIVTDCYNAMLNRTPDASGSTYWNDRLNVGMTSRAVLSGFVGSQEFKNLCSKYGIQPGTLTVEKARDQNYERTYFVYRLYANCLGRTPDTNGLEDWCNQILKGKTGSNLAYGFIFSKEYKNKHVSNEEFVDMMYKTMMGRQYDEAGFKDWLGKLNYSNTREHVMNGFLFSKEFKNLCAKAGIDVGTKINEIDDSDAWKFNVEILQIMRQRSSMDFTLLQDLYEAAKILVNEGLSKNFNRPDGSSWVTAFSQVGLSYTHINGLYQDDLPNLEKVKELLSNRFYIPDGNYDHCYVATAYAPNPKAKGKYIAMNLRMEK